VPIDKTELRDEVLANLEIDATDEAKFKVFDHLNQAQEFLANSLPHTELESIKNDLKLDIGANQSRYSWPDGILYSAAPVFRRFISLWLATDGVSITDAAPGKKCTKYDEKLHSFPISNYGTIDYPFVDINGNDEFIISPVSSSTITDGIQLIYIRTPVKITASVDSELNNRFKSWMILRATELSCLVENYRPKMSAEFKTKQENELLGILPKGGPE